jgi:hypothetical protein
VRKRVFFAAGATVCGVWLILVPMIVSYPSDPRSIDAVLGIFVIVIGASEIRRVVGTTRTP